MNRDRVYPKYMVWAPLIIFAVFFVIPSTIGYLYAFTNWSSTRSRFSDISFVGLTNILEMLYNRRVPIALGNTFIYAIAKTGAVTVIGLMLAYILNRDIRSKNLLRAIYFLPAVLSTLVVGLIFKAVFQTRGGTVNSILLALGYKPVQWLGSRWIGVFSICFAEIWRNVGYAMVISLAGMQSVSHDYLEAAAIDGAGAWQVYKNVTLPLIMPTVNVNILNENAERFHLPQNMIRAATDDDAVGLFRQFHQQLMLLRKNGHVVLKYRIRHGIERKGMAYMNGKGFHRLFFADPAHIFLGTPGAFGDFRNNFPVVVGDLQLF